MRLAIRYTGSPKAIRQMLESLVYCCSLSNEDSHKISDNFDFGPDRNMYFGFIHPFAGENVVLRMAPLTFD